MKINQFLIVVSIMMCAISCSGPEARKPISKKTNVFLRESVALNKSLNDREKLLITSFMDVDSTHIYKESSLGFWYAMIQSKKQGELPQTDDTVYYNFEVYNLKNELLYPKDSLNAIMYKVDKQEHEIEGLQQGIKIMKEGERAVFLFPSFKAYGLVGDGHKIGVNEPIKVIIELIEIKK
ncbi:MAG: gliding motility-associated peptidyl-prolyl isomerase GldI [Flavobacteriaceae bacterium]|nr:MAG: gliding motility-associated peptidyl-prolyl isomerase GldI [Flavobacteriaceae bacterium]